RRQTLRCRWRTRLTTMSAAPTTTSVTSSNSGQLLANETSPARHAHGEYLKRSSNTPVTFSMRHRVEEIVDREPVGDGRELLGIVRVVGVLPRIPEIHVPVDDHDQSSRAVIDTSPMRRVAVLLPG